MDLNYDLEVELKREVYKNSYFEFFKWAFRILKPEDKYEDNFHVKYLCDLLQAEIERIIRREAKGQDIIINIPPRTSKSLITSVCLLAWAWTRAPHLSMIAISFDDSLSLSNAQYCKDIIKSEEYQLLFPEVQIRRDVDSKGEFQNTKGGSRRSTTTGSNITGKGAEIIVVDDPQNPLTAESEKERATTIKYYIESLWNRLTPLNLGIRVLVQQRLHFLDLSAFLLDNHADEHLHICLPAELTEGVRPVELKKFYINGLLDPTRLGIDVIPTLKKKGSRYYAGQYLQTPTPEEGGIIKGNLFDIVEPHTLVRNEINEPINFIADTAYTAKTENDPTAILTFFKKDGFLYILDAVEQWMEFPQLIEFLKTYTGKFQYNSQSRLLIEGAASGLSIVQQLRSTTQLNVIEIKKPKDDKITRAYAITAILESRRVKLVRGGYIEKFLAQLTAFPNGVHDDMVDTLIYAVSEFLMSDNPDFLFL